MVEIFRQKTAPAFEVALRMGALYAGADEDVRDVLSKYSEALGIAYQIHDDLEDLSTDGHAPDDVSKLRPSLLLAVANERVRGEAKPFMESVWRRQVGGAEVADRVRKTITEFKVDDRCRKLYESYKEEAIRALVTLENPSLKGLLRRVITKIFNDLEVKGWCSEHERRELDKAMGEQAIVESAVAAGEAVPVG